jgi:hypothetical protein
LVEVSSPLERARQAFRNSYLLSRSHFKQNGKVSPELREEDLLLYGGHRLQSPAS